MLRKQLASLHFPIPDKTRESQIFDVKPIVFTIFLAREARRQSLAQNTLFYLALEPK